MTFMTWLQSNTAVVTAIATLAIAWFTYVLARSTKKLWQAQNRAFQDTERAFIYLDGVDPELTHGDHAKVSPEARETILQESQGRADLYITRFAVSPRWKNSGNTPTKNMTIQINWTAVRDESPPEYTYQHPRRPFFVPPHAIEPSGFIEIPEARDIVLRQLKQEPDAPVKTLLIWGRAEYDDIFDRSHFLEWCYAIRFDDHAGKGLRARFLQWGKYNRTD